jgi:hypothetical protein
MVTRNISWGKRRPMLMADNLTWPVQAYTGITSILIFTHVFRNAGHGAQENSENRNNIDYSEDYVNLQGYLYRSRNQYQSDFDKTMWRIRWEEFEYYRKRESENNRLYGTDS